MNKNKLPLRLLRQFCRPDLLEELEGDLMEMYESQKAERGAKKAIRWLWWEVVKLFRPGIVRSLEGTYSLTNYGMLKSHLKSSTRIIWRQKFYSVIIVLSLALGLSFSTVFVTYLSQQSRVDNFHPNKDRLFRLLGDDPFDESRKISFVMDKTSEYLISNYPAIRAICRLNAPDQIAIVHNGNVFDDKVLLAVDSSFFWMFGFELMHGNRKNALTKNGIVISDQLSALLFGDENPISKTIRVQTDSIERPLNVTGVFRQGENSHLRFDALLYYPDFASRYAGSPTYVLLQDKAASTPLEGLFAEDKNVPGLLGPGSSSYYLQPLKDIYFDTANTRTFSFAISGRF
ncbi:MAG: ABC transporter permease, partial [Cyclobacteriaceae bacterium]|nr:ABC transporter permease [Cyclobacteriaceae bacterium]